MIQVNSHLVTGHCTDCDRPTTRPLARYCDDCRPRHRGRRARYGGLTPDRVAWLRTHYRPDGQGRGWTGRLARRLQVPKWRLVRWAATLGLTQPTPDRRPWTATDDAHLEARLCAGRSLEVIARELRRSVTACAVRAKRQQISRRSCRPGMSARQFALAMGVDSHKVTRWIARGHLRATPFGTARTPGQGGDEWVITDQAIRRFLRGHPADYSLRQVDQVWFLGLVFGELGQREAVA